MARRNQQLTFAALWPGLLVAILTTLLAGATLATLLLFSSPANDTETIFSRVFNDRYLWHVMQFTFWQALLSVICSVLPAILLALALYRRHFPGRQWLLRLCNMTLVLPVLVAVFGILTVYGQQGWLAQLAEFVGIAYNMSIYGLQGILLAHIFFNLPLACRLFLQILEEIPAEQHKIAAQLGLNHWQCFKFIQWPVLQRQVLPACALIFMLCFASFTVILSLGGGPRNTTIELAIYQALRYDFDLPQAALLALLQLLFCLILLVVCQRLSRWLPAGQRTEQRWRQPATGLWLRLFDMLIIGMALILLLPPLLAVVVNGLNPAFITVLSDPLLWQAIFTSLFIAISAGLLAFILAFALLWSCRDLHFHGYRRTAKWLSASSMLILAMPAIVLASGCFLLFIHTVGLPDSPYVLLIVINALMALPYCMKLLTSPMYDLYERYHQLIQSLGIPLFSRLRLIEFSAMRQPIAQALAFACVLSMGDLTIIALFGNSGFITLPYYLYSQLGAYRSNNAAVSAFILLILCLLVFTLIEKLLIRHDKT